MSMFMQSVIPITRVLKVILCLNINRHFSKPYLVLCTNSHHRYDPSLSPQPMYDSYRFHQFFF